MSSTEAHSSRRVVHIARHERPERRDHVRADQDLSPRVQLLQVCVGLRDPGERVETRDQQGEGAGLGKIGQARQQLCPVGDGFRVGSQEPKFGFAAILARAVPGLGQPELAGEGAPVLPEIVDQRGDRGRP